MNETYLYTCNYCQKQYVPKRRKVQQYCSDSCRVRNNQDKNKSVAPKVEVTTTTEITKKPIIDKSSVLGAAIGTATVLIGKKIISKDIDKPVTKRDIIKFANQIHGERYRKIENYPPNQFGQIAYFDLETNQAIYSYENLTSY